jgi:hypothetical protein
VRVGRPSGERDGRPLAHSSCSLRVSPPLLLVRFRPPACKMKHHSFNKSPSSLPSSIPVQGELAVGAHGANNGQAARPDSTALWHSGATGAGKASLSWTVSDASMSSCLGQMNRYTTVVDPPVQCSTTLWRQSSTLSTRPLSTLHRSPWKDCGVPEIVSIETRRSSMRTGLAITCERLPLHSNASNIEQYKVGRNTVRPV